MDFPFIKKTCKYSYKPILTYKKSIFKIGDENIIALSTVSFLSFVK